LLAAAGLTIDAGDFGAIDELGVSVDDLAKLLAHLDERIGEVESVAVYAMSAAESATEWIDRVGLGLTIDDD
jgi:hypothetical protein